MIEPQQRSRYSLDELLARCNPQARGGKLEREWLENKPAGRELI
jgi:antitoxin ChpS